MLQDPIQRYLLADEVGLGKTVEAGIVLRQLLLDNPRLSVQLVLPPFLIGQWKRELLEKFFTDDFSHAQIRFARNDEPESWAAADILVVDEAHNLAALAGSQHRRLTERYTRLAAIARETPKLLLLSATPALHNEPVFLEMLRLLDPAIYAEVSVEQLRARLSARAALGRTFLGLQPGLPALLLRSRLAEIRAAFDDDHDVMSLVERGSIALEAGDRDTLNVDIAALRTHVGEVYRLHRRMLRTRRTSALGMTYRVTGRRKPDLLQVDSDLLAETTRLLDLWRQEVLAAHEDDPVLLLEASRELAQAVSLSFDPQGLSRWAASRPAASVGEQTALDRIVRDLAFRKRREEVARPIADALTYQIMPKERVVIFCATPELATDIAAELRDYLGDSAVFEHRHTSEPEQAESAIRSFERARDTAVLVADSSAEEGRNFQFADLLVHVGVPAGANQLEQRIGRCDRWLVDGGVGHWRSLLVTEGESDGTFAMDWYHILDTGFGLFESSIASLQFGVAVATEGAWARLLAEGFSARDSISKGVQTSLDLEVQQIREQDALDSLESVHERGSIHAQLDAFESRATAFGQLTHELLAANEAPGNLRFRVIGDPRFATGGYDALGRSPGKNLQIPLVSVDRLERDFLPIRDRRGTFRREVAVRQAGTHLFRYGDQFIDAVSDFLWNDDRGRAFGMWRWIPDWAGGDMIAYRFDYAIEAHPTPPISETGETHVDPALAHRADGLLPPLIVTVWIGPDGRHFTDPDLVRTLESAYRKPTEGVVGGDFSLNRARIRSAYKFIPVDVWSREWRFAERAAIKITLDLPALTEAIANAVANTREQSSKRVRQLQLRAARTNGRERQLLALESAREETMGNVLEAAISNPSLRLDSTGIVVLSAEPPSQGGES